MNNYKGIIIAESLANNNILDKVNIISTEIEKVTNEHKTPWVEQWTMHTVEIPENGSEKIIEQISKDLDPDHNWYADFKNSDFHYIIFKDKVFKIDRSKSEQYNEVTQYGVSIGIPDYQLDFSPDIKEWER